MRRLQGQLAPSYVRVILVNLSSILSAAVDDDRIAKNPCSAGSIRAPRLATRRVEPWSKETVHAVFSALPSRYRPAAALAAGCGLRQGEVFGLAVEDVDFLRGVVHVRRQVKIVGHKLVFALPKGRRTRDVPLPEAVAVTVAGHLQEWPALEIGLPWEVPTGHEEKHWLVLTTREKAAVNRNYFNSRIWRPAVTAAGLQPGRENGMHALRHWFASVLLDAGVSIKAVSEYLGHTDPGFTLRVYTHLMPASEDKMRGAVDRALGAADGPQTDESLSETL